MKMISLRFSNIYGPFSYHKGSVVAHFMKRIIAGEPLVVYGDGSQVRDFLFSVDLADALAAIVAKDARGVYQLGSGRPTTVNELIGSIRKVATGVEFTVKYEDARPGEVHATWCDITRAGQDLDFGPRTPFQDGLAQTWRWFQANWRS